MPHRALCAWAVAEILGFSPDHPGHDDAAHQLEASHDGLARLREAAREKRLRHWQEARFATPHDKAGSIIKHGAAWIPCGFTQEAVGFESIREGELAVGLRALALAWHAAGSR